MEQGKGILVREGHFPGKAPIEAYGNGGFRFADMSHKGSILCLPSGVHGWKIEPLWPVSLEALAPILAEKGAFEFLLMGTGKELLPLSRPIRELLKEHGVAADPMSTGAAVRTYNVLLAEERRVAAALIAVDEA